MSDEPKTPSEMFRETYKLSPLAPLAKLRCARIDAGFAYVAKDTDNREVYLYLHPDWTLEVGRHMQAGMQFAAKNEIPTEGMLRDSHTAWWQNEVRVRDEILKLSTCTCSHCDEQMKASEIARIYLGSPVCWHCADYLDNLADEGRPR